MIVNHQELFVSLAQLKELELALASKQTASSRVALHV